MYGESYLVIRIPLHSSSFFHRKTFPNLHKRWKLRPVIRNKLHWNAWQNKKCITVISSTRAPDTARRGGAGRGGLLLHEIRNSQCERNRIVACVFRRSTRIRFVVANRGVEFNRRDIGITCDATMCAFADIDKRKGRKLDGLILKGTPVWSRSLGFAITTSRHRSCPASGAASARHTARKMFSACIMVVGTMLIERAYGICA